MKEPPYTASEGTVAGFCSEAFRNANEVCLERAPKGFGARAERLRNKSFVNEMFFVQIFHCPSNETARLK